MSPLDRLMMVSLFIIGVAAIGLACYAVYVAQRTSAELTEYKSDQVHRERRKLNMGPPQGLGERRHGHIDPTLRARRRDADDPRFEQRPQPMPSPVSSARHRHPDEPATTELVAQAPIAEHIERQPADEPVVALPRPGAIRREQ